jgi:hypothetical protein
VVRAGYTQAGAGVCGHHIENIGKRALEQSGKHRVNKNDEESFGMTSRLTSSFRDAPLGAGPESILPAGVMDSGFARFTRAPE